MSSALEVATAYYEAWTSKDLDRAMTFVAADMVCEAPAGRIAGAAAYRSFLEPFAQILISATLLAAFGDEHKAILMYDTTTTLVPHAPGAECLTVLNNKITQSHFLFDRLPFTEARRPPTR